MTWLSWNSNCLPRLGITESNLGEIERRNVAVHFESPDPRIGRFWIGAKEKATGKQDPYFTTEETRSWWRDGASVESFAAALRLKRKFPGAQVSFEPPKGGEKPAEPDPRPAPGGGDPVKAALEGWKGVKIE